MARHSAQVLEVLEARVLMSAAPWLPPSLYAGGTVEQRLGLVLQRSVSNAETPSAAAGEGFLFDEKFYLQHNPDVAAALACDRIASGWQHFLTYGWRENRVVSPWFDSQSYLQEYPDVAAAVQDGRLNSAFEHFVRFGQAEQRDANPLFHEAEYLSTYGDVAAAVTDGRLHSGLEHFIRFGESEGRAPANEGDEYLRDNPDVSQAVMFGRLRSALEHYLFYGRFENRPWPNPLVNGPLPPLNVTPATAFGWSLFQRLAAADQNIVLSPVSIYEALGMLGEGARGTTGAEIARLLGSTDAARFDAQLAAWAALTQSPNYTLRINNAAWVQDGFDILPTYLAALQARYGAEATNVDFMGNPAAVCATINQWVSDHTNALIPKLFDKLSTNDRLVLTNTVYFKSGWMFPFEAALTHDDTFHAVGGDVSVKMMQETQYLRYRHVGNVTAVELPYADGKLAMEIMLPDAGTSLAQVEFQRGLLAWTNLWQDLAPTRVSLGLPQFNVSWGQDLNDTIAALGAPSMFISQVADLSGIDGKQDLCVSQIVHKAVIKVAEDGTEAAAATGIRAGVTAIINEPPPINVQVNRPFAFAIVDQQTHTPLFLGHVANPAQV